MPSSTMRPWATAARSAAPIVTETHVSPVPASSGRIDETRPPPPETAVQRAVGVEAERERAPIGDDDAPAFVVHRATA